MDILTIDWNLLSDLSYQTKLGKSLKNTLRKFNKEELFEEINEVIIHFAENQEKIQEENRIKSLQSCLLKYEKYYPSFETEKVFNDILGIRIVVDDYSVIDNLELPEQTKVADMRHGKAKDDGYRGVHIYFQKTHFHYPIELQFMTSKDRQFNEWLHIFLYKYVEDSSVGKNLRDLYDLGIIQDEEGFRREMRKYVLSDS